MQITVTTEEGSVCFPLEVSLELTLLDLKAILEIEIAMSASQMVLLHNSRPMTEEEKKLGDYQVQDGDVIVLASPSPSPGPAISSTTFTLSPALSQSSAPSQPFTSSQSFTPSQSYTPSESVMPSQSFDRSTPSQSSHPSGFSVSASQSSAPSQSIASSQSSASVFLPQPQATPLALPNIDWASVRLPGNAPRGGHAPSPRSRQGQAAGPDDPEEVRRYFLSHPGELEMLKQRNPPLADALISGDLQLFQQVLARHKQAVRDAERERIRIINADPLDPENQSRIARDIQQKNIEENMQAAIEYAPESFSNVVMLYVEIKVNGVPVKAMVDSGAAGTIMSDKCAERCGVMRLVDRRFAGMAIGVGTQRIIGKVHLGTIQIGEDFLTSSFKVLENQSEDMLLGLDMLKSHQVWCMS